MKSNLHCCMPCILLGQQAQGTFPAWGHQVSGAEGLILSAAKKLWCHSLGCHHHPDWFFWTLWWWLHSAAAHQKHIPLLRLLQDVKILWDWWSSDGIKIVQRMPAGKWFLIWTVLISRSPHQNSRGVHTLAAHSNCNFYIYTCRLLKKIMEHMVSRQKHLTRLKIHIKIWTTLFRFLIHMLHPFLSDAYKTIDK